MPPNGDTHQRPYIAHKKKHCEGCGFVAVHACQLDVDHDDGDHTNDDPANLKTLCANCHRLKTWLAKDYRTRKEKGFEE
jgi:5-methylcytosine-specific restriction endonuclease McrA